MVFIDIWTLLSWLICKKYYIMLKKWRNKIVLYMWYYTITQSTLSSSFFPLLPSSQCFTWNNFTLFNLFRFRSHPISFLTFPYILLSIFLSFPIFPYLLSSILPYPYQIRSISILFPFPHLLIIVPCTSYLVNHSHIPSHLTSHLLLSYTISSHTHTISHSNHNHIHSIQYYL